MADTDRINNTAEDGEIKIEDVGTGELSDQEFPRGKTASETGTLSDNPSAELFEEIGDLDTEELRTLRKTHEGEHSVNRILPIITVVVILLALLLFGYLFWNFYQRHYLPDYTEADLYEHFSLGEKEAPLTRTTISGWQLHGVALTVDHVEIEGMYGVERENKVYVPLSFVTDELNHRFYYDEPSSSLLYALPEELKQYKAEEEDEVLLIREGEEAKPYVSLDTVQQFTDIVWDYHEDPDRLTLISDYSTEGVAVTGESTPKDHEIPVRTYAGVKAPVLTYLSVGEEARLLQMEGSKWMKVETGDGIIGYVQNRYMSDTHPLTVSHEFTEPVYKNLSMSNHICMLWHQIFEEDTGVAALPEIVSRSSMANVICPTVFSLADEKGTIQSRATKEYVEYAHDHGLFVWAMVENISLTPDSYEFLRSYQARKNCIDEMIRQCRSYHYDGINVDFESLSENCGPHYLEFLRELSVECRKEGLFLSVDNYVPMSHSAFYDREEQGKVVDYVIVMCYDEHWGGSNDPGSTASLPFVKKGIEDTLKEVPADRLICGVPFYTRLWNMNDLSSKAIGMEKCEDLSKHYRDGLTWDRTLGQSILSYTDESGDVPVSYQVWLENLDSARTRLDLLAEYDLAGVSFWKAGMDEAAVWEEVRAYMQKNQ